MSTSLAKKITEWRNGSAGFFRFLEDVKPMVRGGKGGKSKTGFVPFDPGPRERAEIAKALDGDYSTLVFCWPRRHGKTLTAAMLCLWRFLTHPAENIAMVANSEKQVIDTGFRTIREAFEHTPALKALVGAGTIKIGQDKIEFPGAGSMIQAFAPSVASLWGKKITVAQLSELHAAKSAGVLDVLRGSLLDSEGSWLLIDSTVGPQSSPLFALSQAAERGDDPTLFFSYIAYRDLDHALAECPPWLAPAKLRSLASNMLPAEFATYHLNQWQAASNALFPGPVLDRCRGEYTLDPRAIAGNAAFVVGAGVDRAQSFSKHGDATVTACVLKTAGDDGDAHYWVLDASSVFGSFGWAIRKNLTEYHRTFGMSRLVLENVNVTDLSAWAGEQAFITETVFPTLDKQTAAFTALYAAAAEGRLHIHPKFDVLFQEMSAFEYETAAHGKARFGAPSKAHDDHVYALAWAVYSLREVELNPYEISGINCIGPMSSVPLCVLNGGGIVPPCAETCRSMIQVQKMHDEYLSRGPGVPLDLPDFFGRKVKNIGAHALPR